MFTHEDTCAGMREVSRHSVYLPQLAKWWFVGLGRLAFTGEMR
jgi:hypothetical protein